MKLNWLLRMQVSDAGGMVDNRPITTTIQMLLKFFNFSSWAFHVIFLQYD
jgi:hypothetical protein